MGDFPLPVYSMSGGNGGVKKYKEAIPEINTVNTKARAIQAVLVKDKLAPALSPHHFLGD
jgi:hypothetical protein